VFLPVGIVVGLAPSFDLPEAECFFQRLVLFLLEHEEAAVAVILELGHHRPVGVEGIADEGVDEPSVSGVQGIDEPPSGGQFAFMADMLGIDIAARFFVEHRLDPQHNIEDRPEQQGHHIPVIILFHLFALTVATLPFDLAH
jgi:hypothetical protein